MKLKSNDFDAMWELVVDILTKISGKLDQCEKFQTVFSPYILCRYISMREDLMQYADLLNTFNSNSKLTNAQFYHLAYQLIPKQRNCYVKYIKKIEKKRRKDDDDLIINSFKEKSSLFDI